MSSISAKFLNCSS